MRKLLAFLVPVVVLVGTLVLWSMSQSSEELYAAPADEHMTPADGQGGDEVLAATAPTTSGESQHAFTSIVEPGDIPLHTQIVESLSLEYQPYVFTAHERQRMEAFSETLLDVIARGLAENRIDHVADALAPYSPPENIDIMANFIRHFREDFRDFAWEEVDVARVDAKAMAVENSIAFEDSILRHVNRRTQDLPEGVSLRGVLRTAITGRDADGREHTIIWYFTLADDGLLRWEFGQLGAPFELHLAGPVRMRHADGTESNLGEPQE